MQRSAQHKKNQYQLGVTILEFIAFIGLAAVVVAGALLLYGTGTTSEKSQMLQKTAAGLLTNMRTMAALVGSYQGITIDSFSVPTGWERNNNRLQLSRDRTINFSIPAIVPPGTSAQLVLTVGTPEDATSFASFKIGGIAPQVSGTTVTWIAPN